MNNEFIYVAKSESIPNLIKIGFTRDVERRMKELSKSSGVPSPFNALFYISVENGKNLESIVMSKLDQFRFRNNREFFSCHQQIAIKMISSIINGKEYNPNIDYFIYNMKNYFDSFKKKFYMPQFLNFIFLTFNLIFFTATLYFKFLYIAQEPILHDFGFGPVKAKIHKNGGGFVAETAEVEDTVYISSESEVYGNSKVLGQSILKGKIKIGDNTLINNSNLSGNITIKNNVEVENTNIQGKAKISDYVQLNGGSFDKFKNIDLSGNLEIEGHVKITCNEDCPNISGNLILRDFAKISGNVEINAINGKIEGKVDLYSFNKNSPISLNGNFEISDSVSIHSLDQDEKKYSIIDISSLSGNIRINGSVRVVKNTSLYGEIKINSDGLISNSALKNVSIEGPHIYISGDSEQRCVLTNTKITGESNISNLFGCHIVDSEIVNSSLTGVLIANSTFKNSNICFYKGKHLNFENNNSRGNLDTYLDIQSKNTYMKAEYILDKHCNETPNSAFQKSIK